MLRRLKTPGVRLFKFPAARCLVGCATSTLISTTAKLNPIQLCRTSSKGRQLSWLVNTFTSTALLVVAIIARISDTVGWLVMKTSITSRIPSPFPVSFWFSSSWQELVPRGGGSTREKRQGVKERRKANELAKATNEKGKGSASTSARRSLNFVSVSFSFRKNKQSGF